MKKYIKAFWIVTAASAVIAWPFYYIPKGYIWYIVICAIAIGTVNFKSVDHVMNVAKKINYPDIEDLKTGLYAGSFKPDPYTTPRVLAEEIKQYNYLKKMNYLTVAVVFVLAVFFVKH